MVQNKDLNCWKKQLDLKSIHASKLWLFHIGDKTQLIFQFMPHRQVNLWNILQQYTNDHNFGIMTLHRNQFAFFNKIFLFITVLTCWVMFQGSKDSSDAFSVLNCCKGHQKSNHDLQWIIHITKSAIFVYRNFHNFI